MDLISSNPGSSPSYITNVPNGKETDTQQFLALDLGGTNLRVCKVNFQGKNKYSATGKKIEISEGLKIGKAKDLFGTRFLANEIKTFLTEGDNANDFESQPVNLGLTFSFPVKQIGPNCGLLQEWTKGFNVKDAIGQDVVKLLQDALDKDEDEDAPKVSAMRVKCAALVNDAVGVLLTSSYTAEVCKMGSIFGTGTNSAYVENVDNIKDLLKPGEYVAAEGGEMIVNTEWGAFDNAVGLFSPDIYPVTKSDYTSVCTCLQHRSKTL
ncbi:hypothetical protein PM082_021294 [Marasmius tenuissimus]|nr:hypothetical protein PM082_021294 [Marasmius tenuissimus]